MNAIVAGTDPAGIGDALADVATVTRVDVANRPALEDAGIVDAAVFVLTETEQATAISVAKDCNPDVRAVVYADGSLPEFARGQADLAVDPALLDPATVAEELVDGR